MNKRTSPGHCGRRGVYSRKAPADVEQDATTQALIFTAGTCVNTVDNDQTRKENDIHSGGSGLPRKVLR